MIGAPNFDRRRIDLAGGALCYALAAVEGRGHRD
jgi:hypothetical protein